MLVISVRNGSSDAYQQVHRVNPVAIDFMAGGNPQKVQEDRRRMLLHRLLYVFSPPFGHVLSDEILANQ